MKLIASGAAFLPYIINEIQTEMIFDDRLAEHKNLQKFYRQILEELKSEVITLIKDENQ